MTLHPPASAPSRPCIDGRPAPSRSSEALPAWRSAAGGLAALLLALPAAQAQDAAAPPWQFVGRQGLLQVVIVPAEQVKDLAAYQAQISRLCPPERTCFVNFYANPSDAVAALPLPDAIAREATARFRRSMKNGADLFQWSCRLGVDGEPCF